MMLGLLFAVGCSATTVRFNVNANAAGSSADVRFNVTWTPGELKRGRISLIVSRDLSREPRLSVGSTFSNAAQLFSFPVDATSATASFPSPEQHGYPFPSLDDFPEGPVNVQAVLTPYEQYNRSDGHVLWLPGFNSFTYSEDYDSYGWAEEPIPFGGAKGLSAPGAMYSHPRLHDWSPKGQGVLQLRLDQKVADFPPPPAETTYSKYVSITSPRLSTFWGRSVNISAWVTLPAGFDAHPQARYPLIINHGHYSYQRLRGWADEPPATATPPSPKTGNPDDCYYCSSGGGCCHDCNFSDSFQQQYANYFQRNWTSLEQASAFHNNRVLLVRIQTPNPFFDDSYAVNSENLGDYGDALTYELIPEIERRYRGLGAWARGTYGGSTGGWEAIAVQVKYPPPLYTMH
jgi:hypothetical protein